MPRKRRYFKHKEAGLITSRVADGLPFIPLTFMNNIIKGILARAQTLYPVEICHFIFMANHYHILAICNPEQIHHFMGYVDGELAKCINRFRGVCGRNVWSSRYDYQPILTPEDLINKIIYIYTNPVTPYLVDEIKHYPGVSSWQMYQSEDYTYETKWIRPSFLSKLPHGAICDKALCEEHLKMVKEIEKEEGDQTHYFDLKPYAWLECFEESKSWSASEARGKVDRLLELKTKEIREERLKKKKRVMGVNRLKKQGFHLHYKPKKYGRRALCICWDKDLREEYKEKYKYFSALCKEAWERWKLGDYLAPFPPGALKPSVPIVANIWPT